jgi:hypothetical protein
MNDQFLTSRTTNSVFLRDGEKWATTWRICRAVARVTGASPNPSRIDAIGLGRSSFEVGL